MSSMTPPGTPGPPPAVFNAIMAASAVVQACVALAYPMALLFIMNTRTARDYYSAEIQR